MLYFNVLGTSTILILGKKTDTWLSVDYITGKVKKVITSEKVSDVCDREEQGDSYSVFVSKTGNITQLPH